MTGAREHDGVLVQARGLSKRFRLYERPRDRLMEWLSFGSVTRHEVFWALEGVDIEIRSGECLGVIGRNGSGKSTLLKLLSGALLPTRGEVDVHGRVYALLELGTGFNKQLTGRQNIAHAGAMLGIPSAYIRAREAQIIAFADLGGFIDVPVRSYSSGMMSRLAFSLFAFLDPDVLMIDEVLSVGDEAFKARCFELIGERVAQGRSVVFVSHALRTMTRLCDRVVWLEDGRVVDIGEPTAMVNAFVDRHRTSGAQAELGAGSGGSGKVQPSTPAADVIVPERSAEPGGADPAAISCVFVAGPDQPPHSGVRIEKLWLESPLGDLRESAPAGLSFVIAARMQGAGGAEVALEFEVLSPSGAVLGGSRVAAPEGGGVLRLLCNAGLGPGVHGVRVRARVGGAAGADEVNEVLVERAAVPVVGSAPTPEGLVLFRRVTLHDCAGD